jgi:hypothetical protein
MRLQVDVIGYSTVSVRVALCETLPDVPVTVTVELVAFVVVVVELPPQPESIPNPTRLIAINRSNCSRFRFLNPKKQSATAIAVIGRKGRESCLAADADGLIVSVAVADWLATTVTGFGLNVQVYPEGSPLQAKVTVPLKASPEPTVIVVKPTVPGSSVMDDSEKLRLIEGVSPTGSTMNVCDTGAAAANVALSPGCEATMVQFPAVTKVAVVPETVQTAVVEELKETTNPELAVAESVTVVPTTWVPGLLKVMVWVGSGP